MGIDFFIFLGYNDFVEYIFRKKLWGKQQVQQK